MWGEGEEEERWNEARGGAHRTFWTWLGGPCSPLPFLASLEALGPGAQPTVPTCDLCSPQPLTLGLSAWAVQASPKPFTLPLSSPSLSGRPGGSPAHPGHANPSVCQEVLPGSASPGDASGSPASYPGSPRWPHSSCPIHTMARERRALPPGMSRTHTSRGLARLHAGLGLGWGSVCPTTA